ncbi:hypothetical protein IWT140_01652 [Secundilactobacillus pentosiphilus]|uniref:Uncharacterized protein n=1 Tax=Secundilactobacillus pentosiphilus TaxID=1714682 RepID=A0A1Z5IQX0_9LACO|nr:hypothetical protein IWT140_01652 [Secundilactobacillus pentosiphilus]GAX07228.1 hypothetical protein IWT25_02581 [Secundilactobacillus pentosiphilus]
MKKHMMIATLVFFAALQLKNTELIMVALSIWSLR